MSNELLLALVVLSGFVVYVVAKVISNMRKSEAQWNQVDKTKLKEWHDDED